MKTKTLKILIISFLISIGTLTATTLAATITVNDLDDGTKTGNSDSNCNLREAINSAVTDTATDGCSAGSGNDEITFQAGLTGTITLTNGELEIYGNNGNITITGPVSTNLIIDANNTSRIFTIGEDTGSHSIDATINGLTIINGNSSNTEGGCINLPGATAPTKYTLHATDITVNNCNAGNGNGGAISVSQSGTNAGELYLTNSTITNNSANYGGGIFINTDGTLNIQNSEISNNTSTDDGGGIFIDNGKELKITEQFFILMKK